MGILGFSETRVQKPAAQVYQARQGFATGTSHFFLKQGCLDKWMAGTGWFPPSQGEAGRDRHKGRRRGVDCGLGAKAGKIAASLMVACWKTHLKLLSGKPKMEKGLTNCSAYTSGPISGLGMSPYERIYRRPRLAPELPQWLSSKESACNAGAAGDMGGDPLFDP